MESPAHHPEICKLSLKTALKYVNHYLERESSEAEKMQLLKKRRYFSHIYRNFRSYILFRNDVVVNLPRSQMASGHPVLGGVVVACNARC